MYLSKMKADHLIQCCSKYERFLNNGCLRCNIFKKIKVKLSTALNFLTVHPDVSFHIVKADYFIELKGFKYGTSDIMI